MQVHIAWQFNAIDVPKSLTEQTETLRQRRVCGRASQKKVRCSASTQAKCFATLDCVSSGAS